MSLLLSGVTLYVDATLDYLEDGTIANHPITSELRTTRGAKPIPLSGVFAYVAREALYQRARPFLLVLKQEGEALSAMDFDAKEAFGFFHSYLIWILSASNSGGQTPTHALQPIQLSLITTSFG
jgi:hypothetical protein